LNLKIDKNCKLFDAKFNQKIMANIQTQELLGEIGASVVKGVTGKSWREFRHKSYCEKLPGVSSQEVLGTIGQSCVTRVPGEICVNFVTGATGEKTIRV
jgi:hypothetical protein